MDEKGAFGSVGAVSGKQQRFCVQQKLFVYFFPPGCKNAIGLARAVLDYSRVPDRLGRVPPL